MKKETVVCKNTECENTIEYTDNNLNFIDVKDTGATEGHWVVECPHCGENTVVD